MVVLSARCPRRMCHRTHRFDSPMFSDFVNHFASAVFALRFLLFHLPSDQTEAVFAIKTSQRVVTTQYGKLKGILISMPDPELPKVEAYLGLEYASLLNGDLRFMPPTSPVGKWDGVRSAIKFKPVCPQRIPDMEEMERKLTAERLEHLRMVMAYLERQQEECLNLNVYLPVIQSNSGRNESSTSLPVLLFVHGESYDIGTGNAYDGSIMAAIGRMIVITLNYRLGVLGFLSTGDAHASGNYGLLDIIAALHWINDNISSFGGDPGRVTVLGHRYGGALVNLLMLSPLIEGRGLMKRVILISGSALSSWAITDSPLHYTNELADRLNCSRPSGQQSALLLQCLKRFSAEEIVAYDTPSPKYLSGFGPTLDSRSVLPVEVRSLMAGTSCDQEFGRTPLLIAVGRDEGLGYLALRDHLSGVSESRLRRVLRTYVWNTFKYHQQKIFEILLHNYRGWDRPRDKGSMRDDLVDLIGDGQVAAPLIELAQYHAACVAAPTFLFSFGIRPSLDEDPQPETRDQEKELDYVFGAPLSEKMEPFASSYTERDKILAETVLHYWSTFVDTGSPNSAANPGRWMLLYGDQRKSNPSLTWPPYDVSRQQYMLLGTPTRVQHHYRGDKMALWLDLIPRIHRPDGFDPRYHLLDDNDNATSFEEDEMRREIDPRELHFVTQTSSTTPTTRIKLSIVTSQQTTPRREISWTLRAKKTTAAVNHQLTVPTTPGETKEHVQQTGTHSGNEAGSSSIGLTIAVGLSLLCLNLIVFAAVYCQWKRLRLAKTTEADEFEKSGDSEYHQGAKLDPSDSDSMQNNIAARYLSERRSHRTNNDLRFQGETLPLKVRNSPFHSNQDQAVLERSTLPKRNSSYDRVSFERVSPTDFKAAQDFSINNDSSTLV